VRESQLVKRPDQIHCHAAEDENIDDREQQPEGIGRLPAYQFGPFCEIDARDHAFYSGYPSLWKKKIEADAQEDVRNNKEDEDTHEVLILL
jgi:hypothetical protein